jgi:hypothetical protein
VNRPGNDFFARASFSEDEYQHIRATDQSDALQHRTYATVGADDRLRQFLPPEPSEE